MLAYYLEWHLLDAWRPLLFADEDRAAKAKRNPIAPAERSEEAVEKLATHTLAAGTPAHSFHTLREGLASIVRNTCRAPGPVERSGTFDLITTPTASQRLALELIDKIPTQSESERSARLHVTEITRELRLAARGTSG